MFWNLLLVRALPRACIMQDDTHTLRIGGVEAEHRTLKGSFKRSRQLLEAVGINIQRVVKTLFGRNRGRVQTPSNLA